MLVWVRRGAAVKAVGGECRASTSKPSQSLAADLTHPQQARFNGLPF